MNNIFDRHLQTIDDYTDELSATHWIDGQSHRGENSKSIVTRDPSINEPIKKLPTGSSKIVDMGVSAAYSAQSKWEEFTPLDRAGQIRDWLTLLEDHAEELATLESLDTGRPITFSREQVEGAIEYIEYYASVSVAQSGDQIPNGTTNHAYTREEPYGVVGLILPWNYPLELFAWKTGAALATGNTVVVKPSENAPLSVVRAAQLSKNVLPDGVLNVVNGGGDVGGELVDHRQVRKVSFTGSVPVGKKVMQGASQTTTPVTLELGGKSPFIVFPDADLQKAASTSAGGIFYNSGQSCGACTRILVHESVHNEFKNLFIREIENAWTLGDPLDKNTMMGPITYKEQYQSVNEHIHIGKKEGAELIYGGNSPDDTLSDGFFIEPTVFDSVENDMTIAQEEIFGPVQTILTFSDYEEAIQMANDSIYGLSSGVATTDISLAHEAAKDLEAGSVWVNEWHCAGPGLPFGGYKQSGIGRECAVETLQEYKQTKSINISLDEV